jgi:hypothetical protein
LGLGFSANKLISPQSLFLLCYALLCFACRVVKPDDDEFGCPQASTVAVNNNNNNT